LKLDALRRKVAAFPKAPGVYVMRGARGREVYVGKAASLRDRVRQYFQDAARLDEKTRALVSSVRDVTYVETSSEVEALLLESRMIKDLKPKYNVKLRSLEQYALVEIPWKEDFPRPRVTRQKGRLGSTYYGPFVSVKAMRKALNVLRRVFRFCACSRKMSAEDPRLRFNRPCLDYYIGLCSAPCAGRISKRDYRADLQRFGLFLRGKKDEVLRKLVDEMKEAASRLEFEKAARLRDELRAIESLERRGSLADGIEPVPPAIDPREAAAKLGPLLGREGPASTVEGIDLANLGGQDAVGSVVTFADGLPFKDGYRRFLIRGEATRDDYSMMREVVRRRYSRLKREHSPVPDVILVDGGLGHLRAAEEVLAELGLEGPTLAAISKPARPGGLRRAQSSGADRIRTLEKPRGVRFPRGSPAYRLLQFVRDEAHRFAQHYHHIRRRKRLEGGKVKKQKK
jgi:excinuclease ABC subunit C